MIGDILIPRQTWRPFPTSAERAAWHGLPGKVRQILLAYGTERLNYAFPALSATLYLDFLRNGNRSRYEHLYFARRSALADLVLAECVEGQGRFLDDILNGIWTICEESSWCTPAHMITHKGGVGLADVSDPYVDLFAAETAAELAWVDYLLGERLDSLTPLVRSRLQAEVHQRILAPCLGRDDFWWMGFNPDEHLVNNWNPWINSNWLMSALLLEEDDERRAAAVQKSLCSLEVFLASYGEAGGCNEGPGYWSRAAGALFDCLELLYSATGGVLDVFSHPKVQNMGRFIYRTHIHEHYYVNFADAPALNEPPSPVVFRYGQRIGDRDLADLGAWLMAQSELADWARRESLPRCLPTLFWMPELASTLPRQPLPMQTWLDDIQVLTAREMEGSPDGFFLAAKGGHNGESHNHNDIGSFMVFVDGKPLLVDAGVETYTRKTFSAQRYELWTMQSAYHNLLPTLDGVQQAPGREFAAREVLCKLEDESAMLALDIAAAYSPEAGIQHWWRTFRLQRGKGIEITDEVALARPVVEISLSLLTPCEVEVAQTGTLFLKEARLKDERFSAEGRLLYPMDFQVSVERIPTQDENLGSVWGDHLNRIVFKALKPPLLGAWKFEIVR
jgi:hypothetical protein